MIMMPKNITLALHAILLASFLASSHGLLKWVSIQPGGNYWMLLLRQWPVVLLALAIYGFVFFYYIFVLRGSPVSILYPVYTGLSVALVTLVGVMFFEESLQPLQLMGAVMIVGGIAFMSLGSQG